MNVRLSIHPLCLAAVLALALPAAAQAIDGPNGPPSFDPALMQFQAESTNDAATPLATDSYYFIPASAFNRIQSNTETTYVAGGCIRITGGFRFATTDMQIPTGSSIYGLRVYYKDTDASNMVRGWITTYDGNSVYDELVAVESEVSVGHGSKYLGVTPRPIVDNFAHAYSIDIGQTGSSASTAFCGARVFYSTP
ncbi:hypothetical protein [Dokdonella sp.]|uniref:hypothetical protein n=1 Tax=Dokdonella sp. TaxID=2291710 RepID=UPI0031C8477B|nr:hypothetical protein [Dokdonella sp.]